MNNPNISRCPECNREYRYRFHSSEVECPMGHVWQMKDERYVSEYREEQARVALQLVQLCPLERALDGSHKRRRRMLSRLAEGEGFAALK